MEPVVARKLAGDMEDRKLSTKAQSRKIHTGKSSTRLTYDVDDSGNGSRTAKCTQQSALCLPDSSTMYTQKHCLALTGPSSGAWTSGRWVNIQHSQGHSRSSLPGSNRKKSKTNNNIKTKQKNGCGETG